MAASLTSTDLTLDNTSGASIPGTPSAGQTVIYPKDDKLLYYKNDAGQELPPGKVMQVVNFQTGAVATGTTVMPNDDTIPQITEGDQYMTLAITPTNASNILQVNVTVFAAASAANNIGVALFEGVTANALAAIYEPPNSTDGGVGLSFMHRVVAGVTSALTFRVRIGNGIAATVTFNGRVGGRIFGGVMASSITITEYTA